jgi:site-specific recombinase
MANPFRKLIRGEEPVFTRPESELRKRTEAFCAASGLAAQTRRAVVLFASLWTLPTERVFSAGLIRWIRMLEHDAALRQRFRESWVEMLSQLDSVSFFADAGIPAQHALWNETTRRVFQRLLPSARENIDTARLFTAIFSSPQAVERLRSIDGFIFTRLGRLVWPQCGLAAVPHVRENIHQAMCLLAARVAGRGATPAIMQRSSTKQADQSPFYRLVFATDTFVRAEDTDERREHFHVWQQGLRASRDELSQVRLHMEEAGVSTGLVFDITSMEAALDRMEMLAATLVESGESEEERKPSFAARQLLNTLVTGLLEDTRISGLVRQNLNLLARKTVERTGHGGEHYIAHSIREYRLMWFAAIGGGLLTVFTAALKLRVVENHLPPFVEGFLIGLDYAISFLLLQIFGLALATKQPSMTAATFAGIVRQNRGASRRSKIADFAASISRTQLAAAIGNVIAVCAGAVAFEHLWQKMFSAHYLPEQTARHVYETLHPFSSATAIDAALTGIILWMAALIGGWCENFAVYNRLPAAIAAHPLGQRFGVRRMQRIAAWFENNIASWSTSIALGFMLGFTPEIARFFGLPLDVRHVTLSTGMLALAAARYGTAALGSHWFYAAVEGIGITFVLNLSVSFSIASVVALRAYNVQRSERLSILKYVLGQAVRSPLRFLYPVDAAPELTSIAPPSVEEQSTPEPAVPRSARPSRAQSSGLSRIRGAALTPIFGRDSSSL